MEQQRNLLVEEKRALARRIAVLVDQRKRDLKLEATLPAWRRKGDNFCRALQEGNVSPQHRNPVFLKLWVNKMGRLPFLSKDLRKFQGPRSCVIRSSNGDRHEPGWTATPENLRTYEMRDFTPKFRCILTAMQTTTNMVEQVDRDFGTVNGLFPDDDESLTALLFRHAHLERELATLACCFYGSMLSGYGVNRTRSLGRNYRVLL